MNTTEINVGFGHLGIGQLSIGQHPIGIAVRGAGYAGQAWGPRPTTGAKSVVGGPVMTDAPVNKPKLVSASERCP